MQTDDEGPQADELVGEFERKLERLRVFYEQYFIGIQKREPLVQLKDVVRIHRKIEAATIHNTALRFKFRTLVQKFNSYRTYWKRTVRAIEAGTYHRDVQRMRRMAARKAPQVPPEVPKKAGETSAAAKGPPSAGAASPEKAAPGRKAPAAAGQQGLPEDQLQSLYRRFVKAKKMCGEDSSSLKYDSLARSINRQLPELRRRHAGRELEFEVVIRKGKASLRVRPKE